jgi:hypothetical protein
MKFKIDEIAAGVHPRDGHRKIFVMIDVYLDESGIHAGAPVCSIAGYVGGKGQFRKLETAWLRVLYDFGVPLEKFHTKDLIPRPHGYFEGWDTAKRDALLGKLTDAVAAHKKIHPVSSTVILNDFNALTLPQKKLFTGARLDDRNEFITTGCPNKPYFLPFMDVVRNAVSYCPHDPTARVHFACGVDRPFAEYAATLYNDIIENWQSADWKDKLGDISFPLAKKTPQLQAADLLVNLTYHHAIARLNDGKWDEVMPPELLQKCLSSLRVIDDHKVFNREYFQSALADSYRKQPGWDVQQTSSW